MFGIIRPTETGSAAVAAVGTIPSRLLRFKVAPILFGVIQSLAGILIIEFKGLGCVIPGLGVNGQVHSLHFIIHSFLIKLDQKFPSFIY